MSSSFAFCTRFTGHLTSEPRVVDVHFERMNFDICKTSIFDSFVTCERCDLDFCFRCIAERINAGSLKDVSMKGHPLASLRLFRLQISSWHNLSLSDDVKKLATRRLCERYITREVNAQSGTGICPCSSTASMRSMVRRLVQVTCGIFSGERMNHGY